MRPAFCLLIAAALPVTQPAYGQQRAKADVTCAPAGRLQYDCVVRLMNARSGAPISGATLAVGADMPSMPGMHNVRPIKATEQAEKGTYQVRLALEMHGDWAVRLDLSGVVRDRVITLLRFEPDGVAPVQPARQGR